MVLWFLLWCRRQPQFRGIPPPFGGYGRLPRQSLGGERIPGFDQTFTPATARFNAGISSLLNSSRLCSQLALSSQS
jgi:hypothetical protein